MQLESKKYLYDIAGAAKAVMDFIAGKTFSEYAETILLRSAVERQLEIIGEALAQLSRIDPQVASKISEYRWIVAFRNILIHGYSQIDHRIVSNVLELKLPILKTEVEALLKAAD